MEIICAVAECASEAAKRGWCNAHYLRWRRHGDPLAGGTSRKKSNATGCAEEGCDRPHLAMGWCQLHYRRQYVAGAVVRSDGSEAVARDTCVQPGCDRPAAAGSACEPHQKRARRGTDLEAPVGQMPAAPISTIRAVHKALARERGPAVEWCCATCSLPAAEWAFVGVERPDQHHPRLGHFSTDLDDYLPLCVRCHRERDAQARQIRRHGHSGCAKCSGPHYCRGLCRVHYNQTVWAERTAKAST